MSNNSPIDWNAIDTVLLDMDGTLLDLHFDNHFWLEHLPSRYASIHCSDPPTVREQLHQRFASERGSLNWYCTEYWSRELGLDIASLKREIAHLIAIRPHVEEFLTRLQQGTQQVILVTNAHHQSLSLKMEFTGLRRFFDHIVVSHDFRAPKEEPAFWRQLHARHPFDPQRTLLVDDTLSVLQAARRYGIAHLLTLLQPDSRQPPRQHGEFTGILHFDEIMPSTGAYR